MISFTVETDGQAAERTVLQDAIEQTDRATDNGPAYYMLNCAHPTHFVDALKRRSLDDAVCAAFAPTHRCAATPNSMPRQISTSAIRSISAGATARCAASFRGFTVLGGCCGTDHRHVEQICLACVDTKASAA